VLFSSYVDDIAFIKFNVGRACCGILSYRDELFINLFFLKLVLNFNYF